MSPVAATRCGSGPKTAGGKGAVGAPHAPPAHPTPTLRTDPRSPRPRGGAGGGRGGLCPPGGSPARCRAALCWPLLSAPRPAPGPGCGLAAACRGAAPAHAWHRAPPPHPRPPAGLLHGGELSPEPPLLRTFLGALGVTNKPPGAVGAGPLPAPRVGIAGACPLLLAPRPRSLPRFPPEHTAGERPQGDAGGTDAVPTVPGDVQGRGWHLQQLQHISVGPGAPRNWRFPLRAANYPNHGGFSLWPTQEVSGVISPAAGTNVPVHFTICNQCADFCD